MRRSPPSARAPVERNGLRDENARPLFLSGVNDAVMAFAMPKKPVSLRRCVIDFLFSDRT